MKKNFFLIASIILIVAGVVVSYLGNLALADILVLWLLLQG